MKNKFFFSAMLAGLLAFGFPLTSYAQLGKIGKSLGDALAKDAANAAKNAAKEILTKPKPADSSARSGTEEDEAPGGRRKSSEDVERRKTSAGVEGASCSNGYDQATRFCHNGTIYLKCEDKTYNPKAAVCCSKKLHSLSSENLKTAVCCNNKLHILRNETEACIDNVLQTACGMVYYNPAKEFCSDNTVYSKCGDKRYNPATYFCDIRDNKLYGFANICKQVWMTENLNLNYANSKCYGNDPQNCTKYGRLYNWETTEKVCPAGWHLPDAEEWQQLVNCAGGDDKAGKKLRAKSGWNNNGNGTDDYGFSALPGGFGGSDGNFSTIGNNGYWWSDTDEDNTNNAYLRRIDYNNEFVSESLGGKSFLFSVRCVRD
jgi:uncharacterized protein (TIGR02145 family)